MRRGKALRSLFQAVNLQLLKRRRDWGLETYLFPLWLLLQRTTVNVSVLSEGKSTVKSDKESEE